MEHKNHMMPKMPMKMGKMPMKMAKMPKSSSMPMGGGGNNPTHGKKGYKK